MVVEELARALELWQRGDLGSSTLVTLDGDRVEPSGVVVGGSRDALDSALLRQRREIDELKQLFGELEQSLEEARRRHLGLAERLAASRATLRSKNRAAGAQLRARLAEGK